MINIKNLHKSFGDLEVIKGIDLEIKKGEIVTIVGPSGSGKSTVLRCMNLLEVPTKGQIIFEGTDITDKKVNIDEIRQRNNNREDGSTPIFRDNEKLQLLLERIELVANMYSLEKIYTDGKNISQTGDEIYDIFLKQYLK